MLDFIDTLDYLSWSFALFTCLALAVFVAAGGPRRRYVALAFNALFIANLLSGRAILLYAVLTILVYWAGLFIYNRREQSRRLVFYAVVALLIGLFFLIRTPFLRQSIGVSLEGTGALGRQVVLVIGYSYFMFKSINFLISSYVGTLHNYSFVNFANFIFFFSSFTAGPIGRYVDYQDHDFARRASIDDILAGVQRILNGLIKKFVLVDFIAQFSLAAFQSPHEIRSVWAGWVATLAYLVYVYVDFSAYSDIAVGLGRLFGLTLPENFNYPVFRRNLVLFWENWHMSLTSWIRDHVFTPLNWKLLQRRGFNAPGRAPLTPYIVTMVVFGIWHAPTLAFLLFGLIQGMALALTQRVIAWRRDHLSPAANRAIETHLLSRVVGAAATSTFVAFTLILIRYDLRESLALMRFLFTGTLQ